MEIFEVLDRFEILNKNDTNFELLRRSYVDEDLHSILKLSDNEELRKAVLENNIHSIFRIVENKRCIGDLEDLRKAVLENNLHSLFRLLPGNEDLRKSVTENNIHSIFRMIGDEDLKKLILDDNMWSMFRILEKHTDSHFVKALKDLITNNIEFDKDCLSRGQIKSKQWLVEKLKEINRDLGVVFLCAGWYATLATMIFESDINVDEIISFDIDPSTLQISNIFNKPWIINEWKFKSCTQDIHELRFDEHIYDVEKNNGTIETLWSYPNTIINTSTEHIEDFQDWYSKIIPGQLIVLQNNNYFEIKEHVNCSKTLEEFSKKTPMSNVLYEGELDLTQYKRFMKIGYK